MHGGLGKQDFDIKSENFTKKTERQIINLPEYVMKKHQEALRK